MIQKCALGVKVIFLFLFTRQLLIGQNLSSSWEQAYNIRPVSEINERGFGDAYPWISNDGMRLYYTAHDHQTNVSAIHMASRSDLNNPFDFFQKLNLNSKRNNNLSSWLSNDEKTISFIQEHRSDKARTTIYISNRSSYNSDFADPNKIRLLGDIKGTLLSPSFSQDLNQLIVFNQHKGHCYLLLFEQVEEFVYKVKGNIQMPKKYTIKSGKLSADGLSYYVSLELNKKKPQVYILTRESTDGNFSKLLPLKNKSINDVQFRTHQPHFSNNNNFVVFTRSVKNEWLHNELFIGQIEQIGHDVIQIEDHESNENSLESVSIYPNPSKDFVSISNPGKQLLELQIFNFQGQFVEKLKDQELKHRINISEYPAGSYIFKIINKQSNKLKSFRVLKLD